jgi:hypothetical protein
VLKEEKSEDGEHYKKDYEQKFSFTTTATNPLTLMIRSDIPDNVTDP